LTFDIHVTKSGRADEPAPAVGFTDRLVEDYAPRRFSRRFSRHQGGYKVLESGGVSELPSAVASDDEDEGDVVEQGDDLDPVDAVPVSRARTVRTEDEEIRDEEDEIDELERGDTAESLPSTGNMGTNARGNTMVVDSTGLSPEAAALVFWKKGRADLREVLQGDLDTTTGPINVTGESISLLSAYSLVPGKNGADISVWSCPAHACGTASSERCSDARTRHKGRLACRLLRRNPRQLAGQFKVIRRGGAWGAKRRSYSVKGHLMRREQDQDQMEAIGFTAGRESWIIGEAG